MSRAVRAVRLEAGAGAREVHLCHDLPCLLCGHAPHRFLPCDERCDCPGDRR